MRKGLMSSAVSPDHPMFLAILEEEEEEDIKK